MKNTARQERFMALGREAAHNGVGVGDKQELLDACNSACGPYAIGDRSAWLVGHEQAVRAFNGMTIDAAALAAARALTGRGLTVEPSSRLSCLLVSDGSMCWTVQIGAVTQKSPPHSRREARE